MSDPVAIILHGAAGRMGQALLRIAAERAEVRVVAPIVRAGSPFEDRLIANGQGGPASALRYVSAVPVDVRADVVIDFAGAQAFDAALAIALDRRIAFVSGSTGLSDSQRDALDHAAASIPVLWSANFSLGVAVLAHLVAQAARLLPDWDCEIVEAHHRRKLDAPSGTALMLGRTVDHARGTTGSDATADRSGARATGSTGYAVVRGGDIVGEHDVMFIADGERVELSHRAGNRDIFARGALTAARWIAGQRPGRYAPSDILSLA